jgi:hypothetical protein
MVNRPYLTEEQLLAIRWRVEHEQPLHPSLAALLLADRDDWCERCWDLVHEEHDPRGS